MFKTRWIATIIPILLTIGLIGGSLIAWIGVRRYGSLADLVRRVEIEVDSYRPRPTALPTVLPASTVNLAEISAILAPTPTIRPTGTLPLTHTPVFRDVQVERTQTPPSTAAPPPPTFHPLLAPAASAAYLDGYRHTWQGWNNCAPATLSTYLSYWQDFATQDEVAAVLKPNEKDKNVNPREVVAAVHARGLEGMWLVGGDVETLKLLLSNGIPVMIETWLEPEPNDGMGHYRLVVGYDEAADQWIVSDSYVSENVSSPYSGIRISTAEFEKMWWVFFNTMIVIYPGEETEIVSAIIGDAAEPEIMWRRGLERAAAAAQTDSATGFTWHNLGRALWAIGQREQAVAAFDQARAAGLPWRMFWYQFDALEAYQWAGRSEEVVALTQATIDSGGGGEEIYYWHGMAQADLGQTAAAESAWRHAVWWHPDHRPSLDKLAGN